MLSHDQRFDSVGIHIEVVSQVVAKAQAVEEGSGTHDVLEAECADQVGQRVGRIRNDQDNGIRRRLENLRQYVVVDLDVLIEESKPARGIGPAGRAAGFTPAVIMTSPAPDRSA